MAEDSVFKKSGSDREKMGRFVAGSSMLFVASVTSGVMSFIWAMLMQRLLGPEGFGITGPFLNLFWVLQMVVAFGVPQAMTTFISDRYEKSPESASGVMREGTRLLVLIAVIFAVLTAAGVVIAGRAGAVSSLGASLIWIMLAALVGRQMYFSIFGTLSGLQRMELLAICNMSFPVMLLAGSCVLVVAVNRWYPGNINAGITAGAGGVAIASLVQYAFSIFVMSRSEFSVGKLFDWRIGWRESRKLLTFGWVTAVALITGSGFQFVAPAVVSFASRGYGYFGADPQANAVNAGYFSSGFTYAMAPMLIVGMIFALIPAISEAESEGNHDLMQRYFDLAVRYSVTLIFFVLSVYAVMSGGIVEFFSGSRFPAEQMGPLTAVLAVGLSLSMLVMLTMNVLIGIKKPGVPAVVLVVMLLVEVVMIFAAGALTGRIYIAGVAFGVSMFAGLVGQAVYLKIRQGLGWNWGSLPRAAAASAVTAAVLHFAGFNEAAFLKIAAGGATAFFCYFFVLGLLGGIEPDDFEMVRDTMKSISGAKLVPVVDLAEKMISFSPLYHD